MNGSHSVGSTVADEFSAFRGTRPSRRNPISGQSIERSRIRDSNSNAHHSMFRCSSRCDLVASHQIPQNRNAMVFLLAVRPSPLVVNFLKRPTENERRKK